LPANAVPIHYHALVGKKKLGGLLSGLKPKPKPKVSANSLLAGLADLKKNQTPEPGPKIAGGLFSRLLTAVAKKYVQPRVVDRVRGTLIRNAFEV